MAISLYFLLQICYTEIKKTPDIAKVMRWIFEIRIDFYCTVIASFLLTIKCTFLKKKTQTIINLLNCHINIDIE